MLWGEEDYVTHVMGTRWLCNTSVMGTRKMCNACYVNQMAV